MALLQRGFLLVLLYVFLFQSAWTKVELSVQDSVEVYLGGAAHIPCYYNFIDISNEPHFVMVQWFVRSMGNNTRVRIFYGDGSQEMVDNNTDYSGRIQVSSDQQSSRLSIQDIQLSDQREFFCQVNGLSAGSAEGKSHLRIFAPPETPVIEGVLTGLSVNNEQPSKVAVCEARNGFPKPNITWYRNSVPLMSSSGYVKFLVLQSRSDSGLYTVQNTLLYKVLKEDKDAQFFCEVSFYVPGSVRTVTSNSVNVTIYYPTTMVELWKESPLGLVKEGDTVELRCQGDGNPPPFFIFTREQWSDAPLDSSGDVLILSAVSRKDSGLYQCRPGEPHSSSDAKGEVQLNVNYLDPPVVVPKESEVMFKGEDLTATCNALSSLKTSTIWYKDGRVVGMGNTLQLQDATYDTAGEYICKVTVQSLPQLHTSSSVHILVHGAAQMLTVEQDVQLEQAVGRELNLSCEAQGYPLPTISWSFSTGQSWQEVLNIAGAHSTHSVVSVRVTSDFRSQCNATNDMGMEARVFSIKAISMVTTPAAFSPAEGSGIIIVVIILCLLLLAILGSVLYFLHKKGKLLCGHSGKKDITKEKNKEDIVVEMKTDTKNEDIVLLKAINGDKGVSTEQ